MKNDRIYWIDSRTIKRSCVLMFDGSLVPFCSKCLDACMRANDVLKKIEKKSSLRADCTSADCPPLWRGRSAPVPESLLNSSGNLIGWRTIRRSNSNCTREGVFSG